MKAIFIIGTSHERYQLRPRCGPQDGANAFKRHVEQAVRTHALQLVAEEMSVEALKGRRTVCAEIAEEAGLPYILCDPTSSEREALGISSDKTQSDIRKREEEWRRRLLLQGTFPALFVCGACHVRSFKHVCQDSGLVPTIVTQDFEAPGIPLDRRIL